MTGKLANSGDAPWTGYITARLIVDGRDDNVTAQRFATIEPGASYAYTIIVNVFHPAQTRYDARVTWSE